MKMLMKHLKVNQVSETNQNSMCVLDKSTSLSCNNLSGQSIGSGQQSEQGPAGPQSLFHIIYQRTGPQNEVANPQYVSSTAKCDPGDTMVSGGVNTKFFLTLEPSFILQV